MSDPEPNPKTEKNEPRDQVVTRLWLIWGALFAGIIIFLVGRSFDFFKSPLDQVVIYCAQDQVYAEPIFNEFETETGISVRPVFDNEAVKTVGLANRLLAERNHPQCDVFWGNEEMRTRQLARQNVFRENNGWSAFGFRSRRIVINTNLCPVDSAPRSLSDLTNSSWLGKTAIAFPQFGTTATHFHALRALWGEVKWETWCRALVANKILLVDGNSAVAKAVGQGEAWLGLTDSDDVADGQREGFPITAAPMTDETLLIPNTVAVIRNAPHPQAAQRLFEYLQRPEVAQRLIMASALEGISTDDIHVATLSVDWDPVLQSLDATTTKLNQIFLR